MSRAPVSLRHPDADAAQQALTPLVTAGTWTAADAALRTGLPLEACEAALLRLASTRPCRLQVLADGGLQFVFEPIPAQDRRWAGRLVGLARGLLELAAIAVLAILLACTGGGVWTLGDVLMQGPGPAPGHATVTLAFLLWLLGGLTLVAGGFLLAAVFGMLALTLGVAVAGLVVWRQAEQAFRSGMTGFAVALAVLGLLLASFGVAAAWKMARRIVLGSEGLGAALTHAWLAVMFGDRRRSSSEREDLQRLALLAHHRRGVLTLSEAMTHTGLPPEVVSSRLLRLLVDHDGDLEVTDAGVVLYRCQALLDTANRPEVLPPPAWEAPPAPPRWLPLRRKWLWPVATLWALALTGLLLHPAAGWLPRATGGLWDVLRRGVGALPFLLPPLAAVVRLPWHVAELRRHARQQAWLRVLEAMATAPQGSRLDAPADLLARAGAEVADAAADEQGRPLVHFPEALAESAVAERARAAIDTEPEQVVFDTALA